MISLISVILGVVLKIVQVGARIALNRATVVTVFITGIGATLYSIFSALSDSTSFLSSALNSVEDISDLIAGVVQGNAMLKTIVYALSLDTLLDGIVASFFWLFCVLGGFLLAAFLSVLTAVAPLLCDMFITGLKNQYSKLIFPGS